MDPMQVQNQQNIGSEQTPVQTTVENQPIPQEQVQPVVQEDSFFDKALKGIVDFIGKLAAPTPASTQANQQVQPQNQPQIGQNIPGANFLGSIGNTLENIGSKAFDLTKTGVSNVIEGAQTGVSNVAQGAQNYVSEEQTESTINNQQILTQNYQPNNQKPVTTEVQPVTTEVQPVTTEVQPVPTEVEPVPTEVEPVPTEIQPNIPNQQ